MVQSFSLRNASGLQMQLTSFVSKELNIASILCNCIIIKVGVHVHSRLLDAAHWGSSIHVYSIQC